MNHEDTKDTKPTFGEVPPAPQGGHGGSYKEGRRRGLCVFVVKGGAR